MEDKIQKFKEIISSSKNIVFFGGAGVSTESNIPDFRGSKGIYSEKGTLVSPEEILSHHFFMGHPKEFYEFYKKKMIYKSALPNVTHFALAKLEKEGKLKAVITQNIDGLHQDAGSKNVLELHGSVRRNHCMKCHKFYDLDYILNSTGVPRCECGGIIKPDVVLYEEALDDMVILESIKQIANCDTLIVGGTSLTVYPAASFVTYFKGKNLIIINKGQTEYDKYATLVIDDSLGNVFKEILKDE